MTNRFKEEMELEPVQMIEFNQRRSLQVRFEIQLLTETLGERRIARLAPNLNALYTELNLSETERSNR